ncbi:allene oxide cyclase barrel-like domain-containing protein [Lentzea sp. E54]|uniref:allene oxide cyclase barrel-like domain-containing protein n=1 Tax=Lentzea xerophila TaxID=3435883 RepID=UPI003DA6875C
MSVQPWLAVVALAGALVGADHVARQQDRASTVEVTAKRGLMSAPANIAVGGGFVAGGELLDGQGRAKVGDGFSHCGVVAVSLAIPPEVTAHCTSVFRLTDGELHLSGMRTYKSIATGFGDANLAITGGTGAYANARGEGKATRLNPTDRQDVTYRFTFTITD